MFLRKYAIMLVVFFTGFLLLAGSIQAEPEAAGETEVLVGVPPPPKSSKWPMFLPAIISQKDPESYWSALTWAKCQAPYTLTFSVTVDGVTKKSVIKSSDLDGTREGWVTTDPGEKTVTWQAVGGCGTWNGTLPQTMEADKNYTFNLYADQVTGQPFVQVSERSGDPTK